MPTQPQGDGPPGPKATANPGLVRPPFVYLASVVAGLLIQLAMPRPFFPRMLAAPLGAMLVAVAVVLFSWSVRTFRAVGTPVQGNQPTTMIVRTGPYSVSRNPIYLAFSLCGLGIAICANTICVLATLIVAVAVMDRIVVPREESYLERRFGAQYLDYRASVRRWV